jgi:hypothetical protein
MSLMDLQADPRPIAIARMGVGVATIMNAAEMFGLLTQIADGKLALPVHELMPEPSRAAATVYLVLASLAGLGIVLGWLTAPFAIASTLLNVWVFLWDQQTYSSHRLLATLLVAYLVFARSESAWSISRRRGAVPWWPQFLMMTQLSVCYFFAAISKINAQFLSGVPLSQWIWIALPPWILLVTAVGTIVVEIFLTVGLWLQSVRRVAVALGLFLHLSIAITMKEQTLPLVAFGLTCVSLYGLFVFRPVRMITGIDERALPDSELDPASRSDS